MNSRPDSPRSPLRSIAGRACVLATLAVGVSNGAIVARANAAAMGNPACEHAASQPPFAALNEDPNVQVFKASPLPELPLRLACLGISIEQFGSFVAVAATFQTTEGKAALLSRVGAISRLPNVRYWSTSDRTWRPLLSAATALTNGQPREDFTPGELESRQDLYMSQTDSRSTNAVIYRMRLRENDSQGFVLEIENVSPVRWWALTLYKPGELHSLYFIERRAPDIWTYYSLTTLAGGRWFGAGHGNSYINRVIALYRYYTGIPTDREPPAAP